MITPHTCRSFSKKKGIWKNAIGIECNTKKKLCVLQKKVLSFGPNRTVKVRLKQTFGQSLLRRASCWQMIQKTPFKRPSTRPSKRHSKKLHWLESLGLSPWTIFIYRFFFIFNSYVIFMTFGKALLFWAFFFPTQWIRKIKIKY